MSSFSVGYQSSNYKKGTMSANYHFTQQNHAEVRPLHHSHHYQEGHTSAVPVPHAHITLGHSIHSQEHSERARSSVIIASRPNETLKARIYRLARARVVRRRSAQIERFDQDLEQEQQQIQLELIQKQAAAKAHAQDQIEALTGHAQQRDQGQSRSSTVPISSGPNEIPEAGMHPLAHAHAVKHSSQSLGHSQRARPPVTISSRPNETLQARIYRLARARVVRRRSAQSEGFDEDVEQEQQKIQQELSQSQLQAAAKGQDQSQALIGDAQQQSQVDVTWIKRERPSEEPTSAHKVTRVTPTISMETRLGKNAARKSMNKTCPLTSASSRTNGGDAISDEPNFQRQLLADRSDPSLHEPTLSIVKIEGELPKIPSELVKVEYGVVEETRPRPSGMNDHEELDNVADRSETSLRLVQIKVEPEWY